MSRIVTTLKRTRKVATVIVFLNLMSLIVDLSALPEYYPYVLVTAMIFDLSDSLWLRLEKIWMRLRVMVERRMSKNGISKKWDTEEDINDFLSDDKKKVRNAILIVALIVWLFLRATLGQF